MKKQLRNLLTEEKGQGMTEYGLILGLIAVGAIGVITLMGDQIVAKFTEIKDSLTPQA
jgi:pilus assembly protein Flp/PilA